MRRAREREMEDVMEDEDLYLVSNEEVDPLLVVVKEPDEELGEAPEGEIAGLKKRIGRLQREKSTLASAVGYWKDAVDMWVAMCIRMTMAFDLSQQPEHQLTAAMRGEILGQRGEMDMYLQIYCPALRGKKHGPNHTVFDDRMAETSQEARDTLVFIVAYQYVYGYAPNIWEIKHAVKPSYTVVGLLRELEELGAISHDASDSRAIRVRWISPRLFPAIRDKTIELAKAKIDGRKTCADVETVLE